MRLTIQLGRLSAPEAAAAELVGDVISQPFFQQLRTEQQLGYIVQARPPARVAAVHRTAVPCGRNNLLYAFKMVAPAARGRCVRD